MFNFAKKAAGVAAKRALKLPIVSDQVIASPIRERAAAEAGLVPKRCGLCRHFSRELWEQLVQREPAFVAAMKHLRPAQMGRTRSAPAVHPGSEAARALRPTLTEEWADYGICALYDPDGAPAIWGFAEQPPMPQADSKPCEAWT